MPQDTVKILTIDDEKGIRQSFQHFLEDYDFSVTTAENGEEGIMIIKSENPDLVLTDLMMPNVTGFEVLDWLKQNRPDIPVIAISGAGMIEDAISALHKGAWDYILKPVHDLDVLLYAVKKCLERASLIRENKNYQNALEHKVEEKTKALQISQDRLASIIRTIPDIIYRLTVNGNISYVSTAIEKYGYTTKDLIGENIYTLVHPKDIEKAIYHIDERRTGERKSKPIEIRLLTKKQQEALTFNSQTLNEDDYSYFLVESEGVRENDGEILAIQGIARDITALKREKKKKLLAQETAIKYEMHAKQVFTTSQERFRKLLEASFDGIAIHKYGELIEVNDGFCTLFNISSQQIIGKSIFEFIPTEEHRRIKAFIEQESNQLYETIITPKEGQPKLVEVVGATYSINGESFRIAGFRDITEKKEAEKLKEEFLKTLEDKVSERTRSLNEKNAKLSQTLEVLEATQKQLRKKEKMAALGNLVFGVSHEVNTPLGVSITAASHLGDEINKIQILAKEERLKKSMFNRFLDMTQESSRLILKNLEKAADLIQKFKKISIDSTTEGLKEFDLHYHIQLILLSYREKIAADRHSFSFNCPENLIVKSYSSSFTQIFTHLIDNSLNHGFFNQKEGTIKIDVTSTASEIQIYYSDNGEGILEDEMEKVFDPFYTTKRNIGYTGLGLHIISNIITLKLSGSIECIKEEKRGVKFQIKIPKTVD